MPTAQIGGNKLICISTFPLRWRQNGRDSVSNHQPRHCLLSLLFGRRSKKTSKLRVTGLCVGNSPGPVNSPHNGQLRGKCFHLMTSSCSEEKLVAHSIRMRSLRKMENKIQVVFQLTHWGQIKMVVILQKTFSNIGSWMKIVEFWRPNCNKSAVVLIMTWHQTCDKTLFKPRIW